LGFSRALSWDIEVVDLGRRRVGAEAARGEYLPQEALVGATVAVRISLNPRGTSLEEGGVARLLHRLDGCAGRWLCEEVTYLKLESIEEEARYGMSNPGLEAG
jgi:hypothetical protein